MRFTGTLIEDLMATVERAEQRARSDEAEFAQQIFAEQTFTESMLAEPLLAEPVFAEPMVVESMFVKTWFASVQENADYDSKSLGVA